MVDVSTEIAMSKGAVFTLKLEADLRDQFMAEAEAVHRPASQLVREMMRDFVDRQREARDYDTWFRAQVEEAIREADDPSIPRIPHEEMQKKWAVQRGELLRRISEGEGERED
jgi:hypothetical protein